MHERGTILGERFQLERKLGHGAYGTVWCASDLLADRAEVAVKILHDKARKNKGLVERFEREAKLLLELDHPNIAKALAWSVEGDEAFVAMELAGGVTLSELLKSCVKRDVNLPVMEITRMFGEICTAVDYAHAKQVVHRDLKPRNVMIMWKNERPSVKVLDFGVARLLGADQHDETTVGRVLGSRMYMSPEQARGDHVGPQSDVFSLASILYEMLTLERAWVVGDREDKILNSHVAILERLTGDKRPRATDVRLGVAPGVDTVLARAWEVDASKRFASAKELFENYRAALAGNTDQDPTRELFDKTAAVDRTEVGWQDALLDTQGGESSDNSPELSAPPPSATAMRLRARPPVLRSASIAPKPAPKPKSSGLLVAAIAGMAGVLGGLAIVALETTSDRTPTVTIAVPNAPAKVVRVETAPAALDEPEPQLAPAPEPETDAEPERAPDAPAPTSKRRPPAKKIPAPAVAAPAADPCGASLVRELDGFAALAREDTSRFDRVQRFANRLLRAIDECAPESARPSLSRCTKMGAKVGDANALEQCAIELRAALEVPR